MSVNRIYSCLNIKSVEETEDAYIVEGTATTPSSDRYGDVVVSEGAEYNLPIPLLWQHEHDKPVGLVEYVEIKKNGIFVRCKLSKVEAEGKLKERIDEAYQSLKANLVRAFSIGFRPIEWERLRDSDGTRFLKWDWLELSLVTIPANADATISYVRNFNDDVSRAFSNTSKQDNKSNKSNKTNKSAGASAVKSGTNFLNKTKQDNKMTLQEQLKALREKKDANAKRMQEMMKKSADDGVTFNDEDGQEYDALVAECDDIDVQIKRVESLGRMQLSDATVVDKSSNSKDASKLRTKGAGVTLRQNGEKGLNFARAILCQILGKGNETETLNHAKKRFGDNEVVMNLTKAAIEAGNTNNPDWVGALVGEEAAAVAEFNEFLMPQTILGKFGQNGVPALQTIGFKVPIISQTEGMSGYWVGEGQAKPLTKASFERTVLEEYKVANIAALTKESIKYSTPNADLLVRNELVKALRVVLDRDFIDPAKTLVAGISPASITNGAPTVPSSGSTNDDVYSDLGDLITVFLEAQNPLSSGVFVMDSKTALKLSLRRNAMGTGKEFDGITVNGGTLEGMPVIVSDFVPRDEDGNGIIVLINANDVYFAEGAIEVDASEHVSLEMSDTPQHNSTTPTGATAMVSMWQTNSVAFRAEKFVSWARKPNRVAVAVLTGVNY